MNKIYIGFDSREIAAYAVAITSIRRRLTQDIPLFPLELGALQQRGLYTRPTKMRDGNLFDVISGHPMSTEFAISRFLVPHLAKTGWALFADCDVLALGDLDELFALVDPKYAVMCVKHKHAPAHPTKMCGQVQSVYHRKNWSSVCLWNCDHPSNKALTLEYINTKPGRELHAFSWLLNEEIGGLPLQYNYLVGHTVLDRKPELVHFTEGTPHVPGYELCEYAEEWRKELAQIVPGVLSAFGTLPA